MITIQNAQGIPLPEPFKYDAGLIVHRELKIGLFDNMTGKYFGNTMFLPAIFEYRTAGKPMFFTSGDQANHAFC